MIKEFSINTIKRVIAHRIFQKEEKSPSYADVHNCLYVLSEDDKRVLVQRIEKAINNRKKCFKLSFNDMTEGTMHDLLNKMGRNPEDDSFISFSQNVAEKLAASQDNINIPGGYCLVVDGLMESGDSYVCVIKADNQEVFNVQNNSMRVLNDVFLSPAKDFYKVGFFLRRNGGVFEPYMYDDQFSIQKDDLTLYFYSKFMGLSTTDNDKLQTKNMFVDINGFVEKNITNVEDYHGMRMAVRSYFRENTEGHVSIEEFCDRFLHGTNLEEKFIKQFGEKYPRAVVLDITLLSNNQLLTQRTTLGDKITIITKEGVRVKVLDGKSIEKMIPTINSGKKKTVVVFETEEENENERADL